MAGECIDVHFWVCGQEAWPLYLFGVSLELLVVKRRSDAAPSPFSFVLVCLLVLLACARPRITQVPKEPAKMLFLSLESRKEERTSQVHVGQQLQPAATAAAPTSAKEPVPASGADGAKDKKEEEKEVKEMEEAGEEEREGSVYGSAAEEEDVDDSGGGGGGDDSDGGDGDDAPV